MRFVLRRGSALVVALVAAFVAAFMLAACGRSASSDSLFPLEAGHRWTYRVTTTGDEGAVERDTLTLRSLGSESNPLLGDLPAWRRRSDSGVEYWLREDASGIYRVGSKTDVELEPVLDKPQRFVLKAPYAVGTQWQSSTTAYLLTRRNEYPREIRHSHPSVAMTYVIEAIDEPIETPAKRFDHCLRVRGTASVRVYADPATGWRDMPLTTIEWYCRGVGLVKLERTEPARSAFLSGGARVLELEAWQ
jgi:hypothetical protein